MKCALGPFIHILFLLFVFLHLLFLRLLSLLFFLILFLDLRRLPLFLFSPDALLSRFHTPLLPPLSFSIWYSSFTYSSSLFTPSSSTFSSFLICPPLLTLTLPSFSSTLSLFVHILLLLHIFSYSSYFWYSSFSAAFPTCHHPYPYPSLPFYYVSSISSAVFSSFLCLSSVSTSFLHRFSH